MRNPIILFVLGVLLIVLTGILFLSRPKTITNYPSKGTDIIAYGDSLVAGQGSTEGNDFVSLLSEKIGQPIINLGRGGDTTEDGLARIEELDKYNPKVVLLLLGGNDHLRKMPISQTHKNLAALIEHIHVRGAVVLLLGVRGGLLNDPFDTEFESLQDEYRTGYMPDVLKGLFGNVKYMADMIHPNNVGYQIIADRIYPELAALIKQ